MKPETKVQPLFLNLETAKDQAEYYFNREFQTTSLSLINRNKKLFYNILQPNRKVIIKEFFDSYSNFDEVLKDFLNENEYTEITEDNYQDNDEFIDFVENSSEYDNYRYGDHENNHYPMWGFVFKCDSFYVTSDYMNTDMLYDMGIGVLEHDDDYFLFIAGAGYDFYEAHWIPLFEKIGWIKIKKDE